MPSEQIRRGDMTEAEFRRFVEAANRWRPARYIDDTPALPISQVTARCRRLKKRTHGLDVVIVDYLQLLRGTGRGDNRVQEIAEISMGLKALAKDSSIPVIALSQLSRQVKPRGQAPATVGPSRKRLDRTGRRRCDVRLPRVLQGTRNPATTTWKAWPSGKR